MLRDNGGGRGGGGDPEVELCVVGVAMELFSMTAGDTPCSWWDQDQSPGDPTDHSVGAGLSVSLGHKRHSSCRI